ncbi:methionine aminopeptidase 1D, mitochondrial [Centruroides vittatus]|uniref:methionine aminopeptidase 1D, mitochondrial n=1 Tax=Centruroides vittatus TaxID=120091 RepID=UPI0035108590
MLVRKLHLLTSFGIHQNIKCEVLRSHYRYINQSSCKLKNNSIYDMISAFSKEAKYDVVLPWDVSPQKLVPRHVECPEYAKSGFVSERSTEVEIKNESQIASLTKSCRLARSILNYVNENIKVGMTTEEIDNLVHEMCIRNKAYPSPLNYMGFPKSVCTSVNNVACHGIPDSRPLKDGDIVSVDVSVYINGYHGDCAETFGIGNVDKRGQKLIEVAKTCLYEAMKICHSGQFLCEIGKVISKTASASGFTVVPAFCGHGIGTYFHGAPQILHYPNNEKGVMRTGMTFTIEPVICEGKPDIVVLEDGWTAVTLDNSRCAQFEHTILITDNGVEILTI